MSSLHRFFEISCGKKQTNKHISDAENQTDAVGVGSEIVTSWTHLDDNKSVHQQHADERVLAREEHVGVAKDAVLEDEQHSQHEKRSVLHEDGHDDADDVRRAARVSLGRVGGHRRRALAAWSLGRREHHRELQHAPRPDSQYHLAQVAVVLHLHNHSTRKNGPRSRIEVRPTALLRYHAHTRWSLTFDLDFQSHAGELWS